MDNSPRYGILLHNNPKIFRDRDDSLRTKWLADKVAGKAEAGSLRVVAIVAIKPREDKA